MTKENNSFMFGRIALLFFVACVFLVQNTHAQWLQTSGPYGGKINCLALSDTTVLAGTTNGVFVSINNGSTWTTASSNITNKAVTAVAVSGTNVFAGTAEDGVYLSSDAGLSWSAVNTGLTDTKITSLSVNGSNVFAGTKTGGVFFSSNNGTGWSAVNTGLTDANITCIATGGSGATVFAGTDSSGVFLSVNNGTSWTSVRNGLNDTSVTTLHVSGSKIYAGTMTGLYVSSNNGALWTIAGVNQYISSVVKSGDTIFAGGLYGSMYLSTNDGNNWATAITGLSSKSILSVLIRGDYVFAGSDGDGVYRSVNNGTNWSSANTGLINVDVAALAVTGTTIFAGTQQSGMFLSTDAGVTWTASNTGLPAAAINTLNVNGSDMFAGTNSKMYLSTDNASTWSAISTGMSSSSVYGIGINGTNMFAATSYGVYLSTDNGTSWAPKFTGLVAPAIMSSIAISGDTVFVGTGGLGGVGDPTSPKGVFRSVNNGTSWSAVNTGLTNKNVYALAVSGSSLYAGTAGGVFLSTNNGSTWTKVNSGLTDTTVYSLMVSGESIIAGTNNGIFSFSGSQWTPIGSGLPANFATNSLAVDATNMYAGVKGSGVWKRPLSEIVGCTTPSCLVWPGDTDNDLTANYYDLLPIGVHYGETGVARDVADNLWSAHHAIEWGALQINGADVKYIDCNGDGTINASDTVAIGSNYGLTHSKTDKIQKTNAGDADLYFVTTYSVYAPGADIDAEIWLGTNTTKVQNLYGIGFDISYNPSLVQTGTALSFSNAFIGSGTLSMKKTDEPNGAIHGAVTRINHTNVDGFGKIATVKLKSVSSIASLTTLTLSVTNYEAIDSSGFAVTFNVIPGVITIDVPPAGEGIKTNAELSGLEIYPNPGTGKFIIQTGRIWTNAEIIVYNVLGNVVFNQKTDRLEKKEIDLSEQAKGVYFVKIQDHKGAEALKRIIVW